ncbi:MAG: hypothetical protein GY868_01985 [Deltaproteobacteria bacterium]|nr:hypothetical protein [Deltaproteobacteria bacterium]
MLLLVVVSCNRKNREYEVYEATLFPTTKTLDERQARGLQAVRDNGTLVFTGDSSFAAGLQEHDVILSGMTEQTPGGLVRMVTGVESAQDAFIVSTRACGIEYAFQELHLEVRRRVSLDSLISSNRLNASGRKMRVSAAPPSARGSGGDSYDIVVDYYPFNGDGDTATPEDQVHVVGELGGSFSYFFGLDIDWGSIVSWPPDGLPEVKVGFDVSADISSRLAAEGVVTKDFEKIETLDTIYLEPIPVYFLVFFPEVDIQAKVAGGSNGSFALELEETGRFDVGAYYSTDSGGNLSLDSPTFSALIGKTSVLDSAFVTAGVGPQIHLRLYDVAGPYASIWSTVTLDADQSLDPCWQLTGGFEGEIGFDIDVWSLNIADWSEPFSIIDEALASGDCEDGPAPPVGSIPDLIEPEFVPWGLRLDDTVAQFELADSHTGIVQAVDGRYHFYGDGVRRLVKCDKEGRVIWSREYTWDEAVLPVPLNLTAVTDTIDAGLMAAAYEPHIVMKCDAAGMVERAVRIDIDGAPSDGFSAVFSDAAGDVFLAGTVYESGSDTTDVWLIMLDADGALVWSRRWGAAGRREVPAALVGLEGDIVVIGRSFSLDQEPATQSFLLRIDSLGQLVWAREVSAPGIYDDVLLRCGIESRDGDLIAGGMVRTSSPRELLMKIKPDGTLGWAHAAGGAFMGPDMTGVVQLSDGGYLACGTWWTAGIDDLWLARLDSVGRMLWIKRYDDGSENANPSLRLTGEGGALMTAYTDAGTERHSLLAMRVPVKTGETDFAAGSGFTVADESTEAVTVDISLTAAALAALTDQAVTVVPVTITAGTVTQEVTSLAP